MMVMMTMMMMIIIVVIVVVSPGLGSEPAGAPQFILTTAFISDVPL